MGGEYDHDLVPQNNISVQRTPPRARIHSACGPAAKRIPAFTRNPGGRDARGSGGHSGGLRPLLGFWGEFTPQVGVELRPTNTLLIRATYSDAFKAPSLYTLHTPQTVTPVPCLIPFKAISRSATLITGDRT